MRRVLQRELREWMARVAESARWGAVATPLFWSKTEPRYLKDEESGTDDFPFVCEVWWSVGGVFLFQPDKTISVLATLTVRPWSRQKEARPSNSEQFWVVAVLSPPAAAEGEGGWLKRGRICC